MREGWRERERGSGEESVSGGESGEGITIYKTAQL